MKKKITSRKELELHPKYKKDTKKKSFKCEECRHCNQGTDDYTEGLVACKFDGGMRLGSSCDITFQLKDGEYFMYEQYDGLNCTWTWDGDFVIRSE